MHSYSGRFAAKPGGNSYSGPIDNVLLNLIREIDSGVCQFSGVTVAEILTICDSESVNAAGIYDIGVLIRRYGKPGA